MTSAFLMMELFTNHSFSVGTWQIFVDSLITAADLLHFKKHQDHQSQTVCFSFLPLVSNEFITSVS